MARKDRLKEVYEYVRRNFPVHTQTDFADSLKYNRAYISSAMHGNEKNLTDKLFTNICEAFPGVFNLKYLLTGEGSLLTKKKDESFERDDAPQQALDQSSLINAALAAKDDAIESLKRELRTKDEIIQALRDQLADKDQIIAEQKARLIDYRRIIDSRTSLSDYPFPVGAADGDKRARLTK